MKEGGCIVLQEVVGRGGGGVGQTGDSRDPPLPLGVEPTTP